MAMMIEQNWDTVWFRGSTCARRFKSDWPLQYPRFCMIILSICTLHNRTYNANPELLDRF